MVIDLISCYLIEPVHYLLMHLFCFLIFFSHLLESMLGPLVSGCFLLIHFKAIHFPLITVLATDILKYYNCGLFLIQHWFIFNPIMFVSKCFDGYCFVLGTWFNWIEIGVCLEFKLIWFFFWSSLIIFYLCKNTSNEIGMFLA